MFSIYLSVYRAPGRFITNHGLGTNQFISIANTVFCKRLALAQNPPLPLPYETFILGQLIIFMRSYFYKLNKKYSYSVQTIKKCFTLCSNVFGQICAKNRSYSSSMFEKLLHFKNRTSLNVWYGFRILMITTQDNVFSVCCETEI